MADLSFNVIGNDKASAAFEKVATQIEKLTDKVNKLGRTRANVAVTADTTKAQAQMDVAQKKADELDRKRATVKVSANTTEAVASLNKMSVAAASAGTLSGGAFGESFKKRLDAAFKTLPDAKITADSSDADRAIYQVRGALKELSNKKIGINIDEKEALAQLAILTAMLDGLSKNDPRVSVRADTAAAHGELVKFGAELDRLAAKKVDVKVKADTKSAQSGISLLMASILPLAGLAVPILATVAAGAVAMGGALAGAGAFAGAFALVAVPAFTNISKANKAMATTSKQVATAQQQVAAAQQRVDSAKTAAQKASATQALAKAHQNLSTALAAHSAAANKLTPAEKNLSTALTGAKTALSTFQKSMEPTVVPLLTQALRLVQPVLRSMTGLIREGAKGFQGFLSQIGNLVNSPWWTSFMTTLGLLARQALPIFGSAIANAVRGIGNLITAFRPITNIVLNGLQSMMDKFAKWSATIQNSRGFRDFVNYVKTNGPLVIGAIKSIAGAFGNIVKALAPLGPPLLKAVKGIGDFIKAVPPKVLTDIAIAIGVITGAVLAYNVAVKIATVATKVMKVATMAWTAVQWLLNAALDANPIGIIILLIAGLAAGIIYAYNHSKTFRDIVNNAWTVIKVGAQIMWYNVVKPILKFLVDTFLNVAGAIVNGAAYAFGWVPGLGPKLKKAADWFNGFRDKVNSALNGIHNKNVQVKANGAWVTSASTHVVSNGSGGRFAEGGHVRGPGSGTSDSIPAWLSNGEFVVNAKATQANLGALHAINAGKYATGGVVTSGGPGNIKPESTKWFNSMISQFAKLMARQYGGQIDYKAGAGVAQWAPLILQALSMLGQSASWLGTVERRMQQESGGNPNIQNNWDSNAARGTPSIGLMQTIGPTFDAYAGPLRGLGIRNPLANIYAGINYAIHRYGSIAGMNRAGGYDSGGIASGIGYMAKGTLKPERVLSPSQTESFDRLVDALTSCSVGGGVNNTFNVQTYAGQSPEEIASDLYRRQLLAMR